MKPLTVQAVVATLRRAGFQAGMYAVPGQVAVRGYLARKVMHGFISVSSDMFATGDDAIGNAMEQSKLFEAALLAAGFDVTRPFRDKTILGVKRRSTE